MPARPFPWEHVFVPAVNITELSLERLEAQLRE